MNRFVTADHHFHHANIIKHCARPFKGVDEMDEAMAALWNQTVGPRDEVYHLGDLFWLKGGNWSEAERLVRRLNGSIHLIKGDHDPGLPQFEARGWPGKVFIDVAYFAIVDRVLLIHNYENRIPMFRNTLLNDSPADVEAAYDIAFCGHVHRHWLHSNVGRAGGVAMNVGVDLWHFRPVPWEEAVERQKEWLEYCKGGGAP